MSVSRVLVPMARKYITRGGPCGKGPIIFQIVDGVEVSVVSQDVRFYSHMICPVSHFSPWILVGLPTEVFGFWFVG
jgi:hypothetical protein